MDTSLGEEIAILNEGTERAGEKWVEWNSAGAPSGTYIYRLTATSIENPTVQFTQSRRMIVLK
jgi:hypothetical protein